MVKLWDKGYALNAEVEAFSVGDDPQLAVARVGAFHLGAILPNGARLTALELAPVLRANTVIAGRPSAGQRPAPKGRDCRGERPLCIMIEGLEDER